LFRVNLVWGWRLRMWRLRLWRHEEEIVECVIWHEERADFMHCVCGGREVVILCSKHNRKILHWERFRNYLINQFGERDCLGGKMPFQSSNVTENHWWACGCPAAWTRWPCAITPLDLWLDWRVTSDNPRGVCRMKINVNDINSDVSLVYPTRFDWSAGGPILTSADFFILNGTFFRGL
jgi:hypothetical protein